MFKKLLLVGVVAAIAVVGLKAVGLFGHVKSEVEEIGGWVDSKVPPEKKIAQLRKEVNALDKDIDKCAGELAKEIVEVKELTRETTALRASVETEGKTLHARGEAIKTANGRVAYGNATLTVDEAKTRLKRDVDTHVKRKRQLESLEKALATREQIRDNLQQQLEALQTQKQELKVAVDNLEAQYKELQLQQIESKYQTDNSRLAKVKEGIKKMEKDIEVQREKLNLTQKVRDEQPVAGPAKAESVDDILAPVNGKAGGGEINKVD
jgi:chromosome segregation ATPase